METLDLPFHPFLRAPQHPVSALLQTIPPRAPSRSTRSNILAYTLHLTTASRLAAYSSTSDGTAQQLLRAEHADPAPGPGGPPFYPHHHQQQQQQQPTSEEEDKAAGLWKLSKSLLRQSRKQGVLPLSVERRVALAGLAEDLLSSPEGDRVVVRKQDDDTQPSEEVDAVRRLRNLTAPSSTTVYGVGPDGAGRGLGMEGRGRGESSVAKSLIEMKFGSGGGDSSTSSSSAGPSSSGAGLTAAPHMDYRIVRGQEMRTRAKTIFSTSILPSSSSSWCRRHRVASCCVCVPSPSPLSTPNPLSSSLSSSTSTRRNLPGSGLTGVEDHKKPLVDLIPEFLVLSAALLKDLRDKAAAYETESLEYTVAVVQDSEINVTAQWYALFHSMVIQAVLEGYLVDGWTGTEGVETLFGVGCGVWEGRRWVAQVARSAASAKGRGEEGESDDESEDEEEERREMEKERKGRETVESAKMLFGSRDVAQADFERMMRDKVHEFLNVEKGTDLAGHLMRLNAMYPLSTFEQDMVEFIESTSKLLGRPALAKLEAPSTPSGQIAAGEADPFALARYFCRPEIELDKRGAGGGTGVGGATQMSFLTRSGIQSDTDDSDTGGAPIVVRQVGGPGPEYPAGTDRHTKLTLSRLEVAALAKSLSVSGTAGVGAGGEEPCKKFKCDGPHCMCTQCPQCHLNNDRPLGLPSSILSTFLSGLKRSTVSAYGPTKDYVAASKVPSKKEASDHPLVVISLEAVVMASLPHHLSGGHTNVLSRTYLETFMDYLLHPGNRWSIAFWSGSMKRDKAMEVLRMLKLPTGSAETDERDGVVGLWSREDCKSGKGGDITLKDLEVLWDELYEEEGIRWTQEDTVVFTDKPEYMLAQPCNFVIAPSFHYRMAVSAWDDQYLLMMIAVLDGLENQSNFSECIDAAGWNNVDIWDPSNDKFDAVRDMIVHKAVKVCARMHLTIKASGGN
ncbi:hypothetical protein MNV49_000351 [Pseudohyphozyma bogoriensis]|nr:hypothetical protein MNV49_000351 [Pseudohyphozyma bogoriensis]